MATYRLVRREWSSKSKTVKGDSTSFCSDVLGSLLFTKWLSSFNCLYFIVIIKIVSLAYKKFEYFTYKSTNNTVAGCQRRERNFGTHPSSARNHRRLEAGSRWDSFNYFQAQKKETKVSGAAHNTKAYAPLVPKVLKKSNKINYASK